MSQPCIICGSPLLSTVESRRYGRGIHVVLDHVNVHRCPNCGEEEVEIPRIEELHSTIAHYLARKPGRLTPGEIRWLRTHLGYSSVDFAGVMGVSAETVSRWERTDAPKLMALSTERLLRLLVLTEKPATSYHLQDLGSGNLATSQLIHLSQVDDSWAEATA